MPGSGETIFYVATDMQSEIEKLCDGQREVT